MFRTVAIILVLYSILRFVFPMRAAFFVKALLSALIVASAFKQQFFTRFGGHFFSPELPKLLIEVYSAAFIALVVLFLLTLCRDISLVLRVLFRARFALRAGEGNFFGLFDTSGLSPTTAAVMLAIAIAVGAYGVYEAQKLPCVVEREALLSKLPQSFDGYRIVLLSDLHISASRRAPWTEELASRVNELEPQLILITGDFIDGTVEARREDVEPLAWMSAPDGILGVNGNHEYYFGWREWTERLKALGIRILENENVVLRRGGGAIAIAGLPDEYSPRFGGQRPNVRKALAGAPKGAPVILMEHRPGSARESAAEGADLQLSGHTHGGMVLLGLSQLVAKYNGGFVNGWYDVDGMKLFVSPGTGIWNGFLTRLGVPAEITLLTLRKGE